MDKMSIILRYQKYETNTVDYMKTRANSIHELLQNVMKMMNFGNCTASISYISLLGVYDSLSVNLLDTK